MNDRWKDLSKRSVVAISMITVIILLLIFSHALWAKGLILLTILSLSAIGIWEYIQMAQYKGLFIVKPLAISLGVATTLSFFLASQLPEAKIYPVVVLFLSFFILFLKQFRQIENALASVAASFFSLLYVAVPLGMIFSILYQSQGVFWIVYLLIVTKMTDIGAYFGGRLFGKKPLAQFLSPKKTIEGAIAGSVFSIAASYFFSLFYSEIHWGIFIVLGIIMTIFSQLGDLAESLLKRDAEIKDSNQLPGLGGVLDMLDSLLFTIPVLYCFLYR
jgi:phosphatidate cytidylyltransferase